LKKEVSEMEATVDEMIEKIVKKLGEVRAMGIKKSERGYEAIIYVDPCINDMELEKKVLRGIDELPETYKKIFEVSLVSAIGHTGMIYLTLGPKYKTE
jgi:hypothetical protein